MSAHALPGDGASYLTPIDFGDVCVNVDDAWFADEGIDPPQTLEDLVDPAYANLFVTPRASSSCPGVAFLLATIGEFGVDGWQAGLLGGPDGQRREGARLTQEGTVIWDG